MAKKKSFFDSLLIGTILGFITPLVGVYLFFVSQKTEYDFEQFITLVNAYSMTGQVLSIGVLANLAVFFLFIWLEHYRASKGVILATFIYAFLTLVVKYF